MTAKAKLDNLWKMVLPFLTAARIHLSRQANMSLTNLESRGSFVLDRKEGLSPSQLATLLALCGAAVVCSLRLLCSFFRRRANYSELAGSLARNTMN